VIACLRREDVLAQEAHGQTVLLRVGDGSYYTLDDVDAVIWGLCDGQTSLPAIVEAVCAEFAAEPGVVRADLEEFLADLETEGLLDRLA
jgi:hypothetical protein